MPGKHLKLPLWQRQRRLAWQRACCQGRYLGYDMVSYEDWCELWNTEALCLARGRHAGNLSIVKQDFELPYSRTNIAITDNYSQRQWVRYWQEGKERYFPEHLIIRKLDEKDSSITTE